MIEPKISLNDIAVLCVLANGIIPQDDRDAGAATVHAGPSIAERMRRSPYSHVYVEGLKHARELSTTLFECEVQQLGPTQVQALLAALLTQSPAFFRQIRADVCAVYLSDPSVWERMGFPGASSDTGGYPDFDQTQH